MNPGSNWTHNQKIGFGPVRDAVSLARQSTQKALDEARAMLDRHREAIARLKKP